jgi:beta propeller repeat protein
VWIDSTTVSGQFDIWLLDLASTAPARNLTNTPNENEFLEDIDGSNVVWTHQSPSSPGDIVVYSTTTNTAQTITTSSQQVFFQQPAIQGRYVVFVRVSNGQADVDGFDTLLGLPFAQPVTNDAAMQARPRVAEDLVVYEDYNSGNADITGYRVSTAGPTFPIASRATNETQPDVDGNYVVWVDDNGNTSPTGTDQLVLWNAVTGTTRQLTTVASHKIMPRLSGTRVVWSDDRSGNFDVRTYDLTTDTEELLIGGPGDQLLADIDGSRVVYVSNETGFQSIYLFTISSSPEAQLQQLQALAAAVQGVGSSLTDKLSIALQDVQSGDNAAACAELNAFLHEVDAQTGKKITTAQATAMHDSACQIKSQIGCPCN